MKTPLIRKMIRIDGAAEPLVTAAGRKMLCFCSNNYLSLANDARVVDGARRALERFGAGAGASRFISGNLAVHEELEAAIAGFLGTEACVLFSSGYAANAGTVSALCGPQDAVVADRLNHASIIDGARLSRAKLLVYPHRDAAALDRVLERAQGKFGRTLVVTDSVFSMDGDKAPLKEISDVCRRRGAMLMVDEAHATGLLGAGGRGLCEEEGVTPDIHMGTLSKALGSAGGFIAGEKTLMENIRNTARAFIYSTAPAPASCGAALAALEILGREGPAMREEYSGKVRRLKNRLRQLGVSDFGSQTQILPLLVGENEPTAALAAALQDRGILVTPIRPPTVPPGQARIRVTPMRAHTPEQLDLCAEVIAQFKHLLQPAALDATETSA